ncbi:MAG: CBS domain-containing protein, partial [Balneolaceae bacterium]
MILEPQTLKVYREELIEAIEAGDLEIAEELAHRISNGRIAQILSEMEPEVALPFLEQINETKAGIVISMLPAELAASYLDSVRIERAARFLDDIPADSAVDILQKMEIEDAEQLLQLLSPSLKKSLSELMKYDPESVGAFMNDKFLGIPESATVDETLQAIHDAPSTVENRSYVFVVNKKRELVGVLSVKDLIHAVPSSTVRSLMNPDVVAVHPDNNALEAAQLMRNRRFQMLPVVDSKKRIFGVFLLDDAIRLLSQNIVDQFIHIGAASADEAFYTPPIGAVKKRLPWMAVNVILNLGAVAVISAFEGTIEAVAALAIFLPMITDMGGNVGIQALSVSIRSIALGEVRVSQY